MIRDARSTEPPAAPTSTRRPRNCSMEVIPVDAGTATCTAIENSTPMARRPACGVGTAPVPLLYAR